MNKHTVVLVVGAGLVLLAGCGRAGSNVASAPGVYDDLVPIVESVPRCARYQTLVAPATEAARDFSYFRYLDGRLYEFGPCEIAAGHRNELRAYRYPTADARDTALRDLAGRGTRPTAMFAYRDVWALEIWSPSPSLDTLAGQAAQQVHFAIGRVPTARHLGL